MTTNTSPESPWMTQICEVKCEWGDALSRISAAKNMNADQLRAAIAWPTTQKTVKTACERLLRKLEGRKERS